jgi:hypothetical protein
MSGAGGHLGSGFLALLAGYGYRLWRILVAYVLVVALFAVLYSLPGLARHGLSAEPVEHPVCGRLRAQRADQPQRHPWPRLLRPVRPGHRQSWIATAESVVGIVIEGLFVAVLIQRLFSR